jgi:hypothetical protein
VIDQALLTELQYALLEPPDGGASWPSEVWTRDDILDALDASLRMLLRDTLLVVTRVEIPVLANALTVALPADWIATGMLVWRATDTSRTPLGPTSSVEGDLALPGWETVPGLPVGYADLGGATLTLQLVPTPLAAGTVELLYIARPAFVTGEGGTLPVPDEFASGVKYATLSQLLSQVGRLQDPERAKYCDRRYQITTIAAQILMGGWA